MKTITVQSMESKKSIRYTDHLIVVKVYNKNTDKWVPIWSTTRSEPFIAKVEVAEVISMESMES